MVASVVVSAPLVIAVVALERHIVRGVTAGGVK